MMSEYKTLAFLFLSAFVGLIAAGNFDGYSDVDLRIAERKAIPHYIRHGYEYADIDIKAIMRQRGLLPQAPAPVPKRPTITAAPVQNHIRWNSHNPAINSVYHDPVWKSQAKTVAKSNHLNPRWNHFNPKKAKYFQNQADLKLKSRYKFTR